MKYIKLYEQFNDDIDPYGEENWNDVSYVLKNLNDPYINMKLNELENTPELLDRMDVIDDIISRLKLKHNNISTDDLEEDIRDLLW